MKAGLWLIVLIDFTNVTVNGSLDFDLFNRSFKFFGIDEEKQQHCSIDIARDLGTPQPLYIRPTSDNFFHPNDRTGIITMKEHQRLELFCTDGFSSPSGVSASSINVTCSRDNNFQIAENSKNLTDTRTLYSLDEFTCRRYPLHSSRPRATERCFNNATLIDVGFEVGSRFSNVLTVCHDPSTEQTYHVKYKLTPANVAAQQGFKRPKFHQGGFFPGKNINFLYTRNQQRETLSKIVKSDAWAHNLVRAKGDVFISRGHLAARGDFIYVNEQRSTFNYINVAPQWQSFNGLNWRAVEDGSRRLAADRNITLEVYTGTHGVITLNDTNGDEQEIYLDADNRRVPVPRLFYKMLIDRKTASGIVLIGVNNPHISINEIRRNYIVCNDVSDKIKYIKWQPKDIRRGYSYACSVKDFLKAVPHLSDIDVEYMLI